VAHLPTHRADAFGADLVIGLEAARNRVTPKVRIAKENTWRLWVFFCDQHGYDGYLHNLANGKRYPGDPLDFFVVFALRYRRGELSKQRRGLPSEDGHPVLAGSVSKALQAIGEKFTELGQEDPRLYGGDKLVPRIAGLLQYFSKEDPAASRVWPVCLTILEELAKVLARLEDQIKAHAILDLCIIGYYFMCRPGEYAVSSNTDWGLSRPFRLRDVQFVQANGTRISSATCSCNDLKNLIHASLTFSDQKNSVKGESIGHDDNAQTVFNPVQALRRRVMHLHLNNAPPDTPLHRFYSEGPGHTFVPSDVTTREITTLLREAAKHVEHITGIPPQQIQAYSLRSGGATALLCANKDPTTIQILGRWKSDAMFRYLRTQARTYVKGLSNAMFDHGRYTFSPSTIDTFVDLVPDEAAPHLRHALASLKPSMLTDTAGTNAPAPSPPAKKQKPTGT